jgi:hypothetical protein
MPKQKRSTTTWSACKAVIKNWPAAGVQELVHELYKLSPDNRRSLHARLLPASAEQTLADARKALTKILSVSAVLNGRFRHADAKQIADQYAKAADDPAAVCDLLISDFEISFPTFHELGADELMADHFYATLNRLVKVSVDLSRESLQQLAPRLKALADEWGNRFGYGISDELCGFVSEWLERSAHK